MVVTRRPSRRVTSSVGEAEAVEAELVLVGAPAPYCNIDGHDGRAQSERDQRAGYAKSRALSAGQQCRNESAAHRERAKRVHVAMDPPVLAGREAAIDHTCRQSCREQLFSRRHTFLAVKEFRGELPTHTVGNLPRNSLRLYARV